MSKPCPTTCDCGFDSPPNERTYTLIISNVVWGVMFIASEILGRCRNSRSKSLSEFIQRNILHMRVGDEQQEEEQPVASKKQRTLQRLESERPVSRKHTASSDEREYRAFRDWLDLRAYSQYKEDRKNMKLPSPKDVGSGSSSSPPDDTRKSRSADRADENRRRTPSYDRDVIEQQ